MEFANILLATYAAKGPTFNLHGAPIQKYKAFCGPIFFRKRKMSFGIRTKASEVEGRAKRSMRSFIVGDFVVAQRLLSYLSQAT